MARVRLLLVLLFTMVMASACSPPWLNNEPEPAPAVSSPPAVVPPSAPTGQQSSCRSPEPELHNAARSVIGDITIARPGVEGDAERVQVVVCKLGDTRATATVTVFGMRDDSIRDTRHELVLDKLMVDGWVVSQDTTTHRCRPGRGHQDFSAELCI